MWLSGILRSEKRLSELERVVTALDKRQRDLELDAADLFERSKNMLKKTARERARIEEASGTTETAVETAPPSGNGRLPQGGLLSERQREIQQQILRRRGGL